MVSLPGILSDPIHHISPFLALRLILPYILNKCCINYTVRKICSLFFFKMHMYMNLALVFLSLFICIFLDFLYCFFDFYILHRLFCYLFMSLFYAGPMSIAVFITEMVILHKYVIIIIIIIIIIITIIIIIVTIINNYWMRFL